MKLPICLIGEENKALAALRQQLEGQAAYAVESNVCGYGEALEHLRSNRGAVVAIVDLNENSERAFAVRRPADPRRARAHRRDTSRSGVVR